MGPRPTRMVGACSPGQAPRGGGPPTQGWEGRWVTPRPTRGDPDGLGVLRPVRGATSQRGQRSWMWTESRSSAPSPQEHRSPGSVPRQGTLTVCLAPAALQDTQGLCHHVLWATHKGHLLLPGPTLLLKHCPLQLHRWLRLPWGSWLGWGDSALTPRGCSGSASQGTGTQKVPQGGSLGSQPAPLTIFSKLMRFSAIVRLPSWMKVMSARGVWGSDWVFWSLGWAGCPQRGPWPPTQPIPTLTLQAKAPTFEQEGHEGDDGGAQLGDGQAIDPVVPRRVLGTERDLSAGQAGDTVAPLGPCSFWEPQQNGVTLCHKTPPSLPSAPPNPPGRGI